MWSVLALLAILWNYGNCQDTDLPDTTIDLYQGTHPADIVFLLDTSTSNNVDLYNNIRSFLVHFVENSSVESGAVRFAFVPYTSYPDVKFYLNKYTRKADIITAIRDATFNYGERNTADAFDLLRRQVFTEGNGDRPQVPNIILMITTGTSDRNSYRTIQEAEALRFAGVGIFAIGIGLTNAREIEAMASRPTRENTFQLTSVDDLEAMRDIIFAQIFTRAEQSFRSPVTGSEQLDLIFLLHFSNNMRKESLNLVLEFVQNLLEYADIDSGQVRVGISIYRKTATNLYNLDRFSTKGELMEGIQKITTQYKAKAANTAAGLDFLRTDAFVGKAGDRPNVPNAVIIITDANSNVDQADAITAAEALKAAGTAIFSIGIGLENPDELDALATSRDFSLALTQASELNSNLIYIQDRIVALRTQADLPVTLPTITSPIFINAVLRARDLRTTIRPPALVEIEGIGSQKDVSTTKKPGKKTKSTGPPQKKTKGTIKPQTKPITTSRAAVVQETTTVAYKTSVMKPETQTNRTVKLLETSPFKEAITVSVVRDTTLPDTKVVITDREELSRKLTTTSLSSQNVAPPLSGSEKADIVFALHLSDKANDREVRTVLNYLNSLISGSDVDNGRVKIGLLTYNEDAEVIFNINQYNSVPLIRNEVFRTESRTRSSNVDASAALAVGTQMLDFRYSERSDAPKALIFVTDSASTENEELIPFERFRVESEQVNVFSIGIGLSGKEELESLATAPENVLTVSRYSELPSTIDDLKRKIFAFRTRDEKAVPDPEKPESTKPEPPIRTLAPPRQDEKGITIVPRNRETRTTTRKPPPPPTTTTPKPTTTPKATTTTTKPTTPKPTPSTTKPTTTTTTTPKPTTPKPTPTTTKSTTKATTPRPTTTTARKTTTTPRRDGYDLVMVLDSSVNSSTFNWMMDVARDTIRELSIDDEEWRVGLVTYSTNPNREFNLNQYKKKADVLRQVDRISYRPGQTNTASALKYVRTNMFRESNGDRNFAKNYVILITGNEKSLDMYAAAEESYQMQRDGVATYVIGLGVNDKTELDELASLPLADYEVIIPAPNQIGEKPGEVIYNIRSRSPTPNPPPQRPRTTPGPVIPLEDLVCKSTGDIVFILDSSGSVGLENFYRVLNFTYNTVHQLDVESGKYRVGLVTFSDSARIEFYLNTYKKRGEIEPALQKVRYVYGSTHTAAALRRVRQEIFRAEAGDRPDVPNIVVMVTDGNSNVNHEMTLVEADMLKRAGVSMITVAVGFQRETRELVGLTSAPVEENLIYADDYRSLDKLSRKLLEPLCTDSDLCRTSPCRNDAICIDGIRSYTCLCPESYYGTNCEKQCSEPADVVFILDSSNTVGESSFQRMKDYVGSLIMEMNVEACNINVGLMKYSSAPMIQWGLGTYRDTDANIRAVNQVHYTRGVANMAAALKSLRTDIFNGRGGDRPKAKNIAYLLTDGSNNVHEEETQKNAELAISSGIRIIPVGVSLREREDVDLIAGAQDLNTIILDETIGEINEAALAPMVRAKDYCAGNPCKNGGKCLNESFGFTCECPAGFTGEDCTRSCSAGGDVVFAVDTSRYVTRKEMKRIRRFLRSVVKRLRFKEFKTGLVQYSNTANVVLTFADGDKKKNVLTAIAGLRNMVGDPDPAEALAKANFRIFKGDGAMADQPDYLVLLSKGLKNEEELLIQSNRLKMRGTRILGVGVSLTGSERELMESVVSYPSSNTAYYADDVEGLDDVADKVVEFMCNGQDKCAQNPCQNKGKCHAIGAEYYCDCPQGFAGKNCELKCDAKADVVFLLDSSGSVGHVDFRKVKDFAYRLIDDLNIGKDQTRVGLVAYSSRSRHGFYLKDYYEKYQLQNAISSIDFEYGKTNTADGLRHVREKLFNAAVGDRPDAQNFVVVVTDGLSNIKSEQTIIEADLLKSSGVHVYAIGIGKFDRYEIDRIASAPPSKNAFILEDYASLASISSDIIRATCKDPSVCDENPCRNDGRCEPTMNGPVCKCTGGYRGTYCEISCVSRKDIIFVLDSSSSVGEENFELALEFVSSVVEELSRGGSDNRYAMITFSNDVQLVFSLGRYSSAGTILNAIKYTRYRPGSTNTAGGLRTALEISSPEYGDRKDVDNIVILVADGQSNVNTEDTIPAADDLKKTGAKIITIGVGLSNYQELESIGSGAENVYKVTTYNVLGDVKADILENSCSEND